jgi:hypothetical protein
MSLPVKTWWSRALVPWRIALTSTGLSAGLAGSPTGPLENSQTGTVAIVPVAHSVLDGTKRR